MSLTINNSSHVVGWHIEAHEAAKEAGLVCARIDRDIGSWRLYSAGTPVEAIMNGSAAPLLAGYALYSSFDRKWLSPDDADIARAVALRDEKTSPRTGR